MEALPALGLPAAFASAGLRPRALGSVGGLRRRGPGEQAHGTQAPLLRAGASVGSSGGLSLGCSASFAFLAAHRAHGRRRLRCRGRASVACRAGGFSVASVDGKASAADLLSRLPAPAAAQGGGGFALLLVPRGRAAELPAIASAVEAGLGPGISVLAVLSAGAELSLGVAAGAAGARAFALRAQSLPQDLAAAVAGCAGAGAVAVFADHAAPPPAVRQVLSELDRALPSAAKAGAIAALPAEKGPASIGGLGGAAGAGGLLVLALPAPAQSAVDVCTRQAFGPELEVFDAAVPRQGPAVIVKIGTDKEGSVEDAEETEKGTAGIARRVSVPAAAAVKQAMQAAGVGGPKEVWIGVPGTPKSGSTPRVEYQGGGDRKTWALFPWVGVTKTGGVVLGGRGPVAEGLCPKASLDFAQCFRTAGPADGGASARLAAAGGGGGALAIASAGAPPKALSELAAKSGPSTISLVGSAVLGAPSAGGSSDVFGQALALVSMGA